MKTEKNILIALVLNLLFSIFEFIGGFFTNSIAIISDAVHDLGDAISIGFSYILERKSKKESDDKHTYGYSRYSVLGGLITTIILLIGSGLVIYGAINRIINPVAVDYKGMLILAIIGVVANLTAAYATRKGDSINQRSVNLHMMEDVLNWVVVLIGSIIMNFTDISIIDPLMSLGVAVFILIQTVKNTKQVLDLFLDKTPKGINITEIKQKLQAITGIDDVHHIHVRSIDGVSHNATVHVVTKLSDQTQLKDVIRKQLKAYNINHVVIETEPEVCKDVKHRN